MTKLATLWRIAGVALALAAASLRAHPASLTGASLKLRADGRFELKLQFNALAFVINGAPELIPDSAYREALYGPRPNLEALLANGRERMLRGLTIEDKGRPLPLSLGAFPAVDDLLAGRAEAVQNTQLLEAVATGRFETGGHAVTFHFPEVLGTVVLSVELPGQEASIESIESGDTSRVYEIEVSGTTHSAARPFLDSFRQFVLLGFHHILPEGLDHILFVLGLFLLNVRMRSLLAQVTAFTIAHSLTLGLSLYGVFRLPSAVVEPMIALSIVLIAWDNLRASEVRPRRLLLVFGFGLIHGLGFAGALRDLHLERSQFATALVGFNVGIELGQLTVIAIAFAVVGWARRRPDYRRFVVIPASAAIGLVALGWTIQRVL